MSRAGQKDDEVHFHSTEDLDDGAGDSSKPNMYDSDILNIDLDPYR